MTVRRTITHVLLAFVVVSIGYALWRGSSGDVATPSEPAGSSAARRADRTDVFYFHGSVRCATCRTIEAFTREALEENYAGKLRDGNIVWRATNVESPEDRHYVDDFRLSSRTVVLADVRADTVTRWQALDQVWHLVGDKPAFIDYIRDEVAAFSDAQHE